MSCNRHDGKISCVHGFKQALTVMVSGETSYRYQLDLSRLFPQPFSIAKCFACHYRSL